MSELELLLDDCLRRMRDEGLSIEQLLSLYPDRAAELQPLLDAALRMRAAGHAPPRPGFEARGRARLLSQLTTKPRVQSRPVLPVWRPALALASLLLVMLASTTAFAQAALPGEALYGWKLGSEIVWRSVSLDPVEVDLSLATRRANELKSVAHDPVRLGAARDEFHAVLDRLQAEKDPQNSNQIDAALEAHQHSLQDQGISDSKLDELVKEKGPKKK